MAPFGYIGIDFGTSNSHFVYCNRDGACKPQPICLGGKSSVTSCVLWKQPAHEESDIVAYGTQALETWLQYEPEERATRYFAFGFKPDLVKSERARRDAWAFLLKARQEVQRAGLPRPIDRSGMAVVIGVPAEVGEDHKRLTAEAAHAAGFGDVECVEEPLGALAFHLNNGDITSAEARDGVVVIDFGGGTLDVALVNAGGLREPWGDPVLGGRLFDDLFFQWVCEQNAPLEIEHREALVVWQRECRELKESFSNRWRSRGTMMDDFKGYIFVGDSKKWLKNASVREFEARAKSYRPSPMVRRYFRGFDQSPVGLIDDAPIDLFAWVVRTLTRGRALGGLRSQFVKVVLTGGSSYWPFMTRLAAEAFDVQEQDIILSQTPETTIGSGLALYNVLKLKNEARRGRLRDDKPAAAAQFRIAIAKRLDRFAEDAAEALTHRLIPHVEEVFWNWYRAGGSLNHVEERVGEICKSFAENKEAEVVLSQNREALTQDLLRLLRDHLRQFMVEHEVPKDVANYVPETLVPGSGISNSAANKIAAEMADLAGTVAAVVASIGALIVAVVKIKLILIIVLLHPILALMATAAAILAFLGLGKATKEVVEAKVKGFEFGPASLFVLHRALSESRLKKKLAQGRADAKAKLQDTIRENLRQNVPGQLMSVENIAVQKFEAILDLVIQDLGVLELIGGAKG
jgi:molecular chaperone DnaK